MVNTLLHKLEIVKCKPLKLSVCQTDFSVLEWQLRQGINIHTPTGIPLQLFAARPLRERGPMSTYHTVGSILSAAWIILHQS